MHDYNTLCTVVGVIEYGKSSKSRRKHPKISSWSQTYQINQEASSSRNYMTSFLPTGSRKRQNATCDMLVPSLHGIAYQEQEWVGYAPSIPISLTKSISVEQEPIPAKQFCQKRANQKSDVDRKQWVANTAAEFTGFFVGDFDDDRRNEICKLINVEISCIDAENIQSAQTRSYEVEKSTSMMIEVAMLYQQNYLRRGRIERIKKMMMLTKQPRRRSHDSRKQQQEMVNLKRHDGIHPSGNSPSIGPISISHGAFESCQCLHRAMAHEPPHVAIGTIVEFPSRRMQLFLGDVNFPCSNSIFGNDDDVSVLTVTSDWDNN